MRATSSLLSTRCSPSSNRMITSVTARRRNRRSEVRILSGVLLHGRRLSSASRDTARTMSQENVEIVRRVYDRWAEGDFEEGGVFDPLIIFVMGRGFPEAGTYVGTERVAEYMRGFLEPWERLTIRAEEIIQVGDSVVVAVRQEGVGRRAAPPPSSITSRCGRSGEGRSFASRPFARECGGLRRGWAIEVAAPDEQRVAIRPRWRGARDRGPGNKGLGSA